MYGVFFHNGAFTFISAMQAQFQAEIDEAPYLAKLNSVLGFSIRFPQGPAQVCSNVHVSLITYLNMLDKSLPFWHFEHFLSVQTLSITKLLRSLFGGYNPFCGGHWYPCFELLVTSPKVSKQGWIPSLALSHME